MKAIIVREIQSFFSGAIGYLVIGLFLLINGLFLWVFAGPFNIFDSGFADLSAFFELAPWILLFLIPAVTMKAFSEEIRSGTLELLLSKPISQNKIVLGKYFGSVLLIIIAIVPTLLYVITISKLGNPPGNWDVGSTVGSYIGLLFLIFAYTSIGLFASSLTQNQIVAFLVAVFLCFVGYYGFDALSASLSGITVEHWGMKNHFDSVARGVLDTRDLVYFVSVSIFFLILTGLQIKRA